MAPTDAQIKEVSAAAHRGDAATVMNLIVATPNLVHAKEPINGWTPLHIFARLSLAPAVQQMLALGADTEARDGSFRSPLHLAARADASPTLPSTVKGADASAAPPGASASAAAAEPHDARALATMGALLKGGARLTARDSFGMTPLHHAAQAGLVESVNFLLGLTVSLKMMRAPLEVCHTGLEPRTSRHQTMLLRVRLGRALHRRRRTRRSVRCTWRRRVGTRPPCAACCSTVPTRTTPTTCSNPRCISPWYAAAQGSNSGLADVSRDHSPHSTALQCIQTGLPLTRVSLSPWTALR